MKVIIVGGVAGGASCAARLRRIPTFDRQHGVRGSGANVMAGRMAGKFHLDNPWFGNRTDHP